MGLRRRANLVLVAAPYAVSVPLAFAAQPLLAPADALGLTALAVAPGALAAQAFVGAAGGRRADLAGALSLGTVIVAVVLAAMRSGATSVGLVVAQAFLLGMVVGGAVPAVRERIVTPLRWAVPLAAVAVVALAVVGGSAPAFQTLVVAFVYAAIVGAVAAAAALALGRDVLSAIAAAGTRDPIVAMFIAWSIGGVEATAVPLVNAAILGIAAAALLIHRR